MTTVDLPLLPLGRGTDIASERGVQLTDEVKEKILGLNAARLYNIDIAARKKEFASSPVSIAAE